MSRRKHEVSLDGLVAHLDSPGDSKLYSDGRRGEREIIAGCAGESARSRRERCLNAARMRVARFAPYLLDVLYLIVKNGDNRQESIAELAVRQRIGLRCAELRYHYHRERLLMLFGEW